MTHKILLGLVLGAMLGIIFGVLCAVALAYLNQLRPGLADYQRDLWSLAAIFLAIILGPIAGAVGAGVGALFMYLRTRKR